VSAGDIWLPLLAELNGGRIPDGTSGVRDVDAPCEAFKPHGAPWERAPGDGSCDTDGHYICAECVHISQREARRRQDLCEECGAKIENRGRLGERCSAGCWDEPVRRAS
jgi:DNA-directed RNA polymerase subunit RPC12/RpoP